MKKIFLFCDPSALQARQMVRWNLFACFPLICCWESPQSGGANAKRAVLSTFQQSSGQKLARSSLTQACSSSTVSIFTDPAWPCLQISLSWCLLKYESWSSQFKAHLCPAEWLNPPSSRESFIFWDIQCLLKQCLLCNEHLTIDGLMLLWHVLNPQPHCTVHIWSCGDTWLFTL